jgi:hypothetical protein
MNPHGLASIIWTIVLICLPLFVLAGIALRVAQHMGWMQ